MNRKSSGLIGSLLALSSPLAMAGTGGFLEMNLEELLAVNITGSTLREESIKTVPASTSVYTRAQIEALGLDYLHELLNLVPGFQSLRTADSPMSYAFSIRGRRQSGQSREVLILVDGRVFTDPRSGGIEGAIHLYPLANIERVEVIRGPGSAIYGSGAFTGVINIVSRKRVNELAIGVGDNNLRAADIHLSKTLEEWQTNLYSHVADDDGEQYAIGTETTRDPRREMLVDWNIRYRDSSLQAFYSEQEADDFYVLEKINNGFNSYWQAFHHLRFDQQLNPTDSWKINLAISHEKAAQELTGILFPAGTLAAVSLPPSNAPILTKGVLSSEAYRVNLANDVDISRISSVQFGLEWQHQREINARSFNNYDLLQLMRRDFPVTYFGDLLGEIQVGKESSRAITGIYSQWLYQFNERTRLTSGLRYDHYESLDTRVSPRFALVHQLSQVHTLKLLYSEAFRAPTFGETDLQNNQFLIGNPNLESEVVKTTELVWGGTWNGLTLGASAYQNYYEKPISAGFDGATRTYVNGERQKNYGIGVRADWQWNDQWILRGFISSFHELPDAYFREADELGSFTVNYQHARWNWNLSTVYHGERQYQLTSSQRATLDSYWYMNSQLRYDLNKQTSIALAVKNLTDKKFFTPAQGSGVMGGVPNRGREISINLSWQF